MKLTNKQKIDLETILFFIPNTLKHTDITNEDIKMFFEFSDKWLHKELRKKYSNKINWFNTLCEWKRWRGIYIWIYEEWVLDWSMPYSVIFEWMPENVIIFLKKEMFKGINI